MIVYHGSNVVVERPRILTPKENRTMDFGYGFYTTYNETQAQSFAVKVTRQRKAGKPTVNVYEVPDDVLGRVKTLKFDSPDEKWLDFVSDNRAGIYAGDSYDCIFGPVANDDVYQTFAAYTAGILTKEQTIENLKIKKLFNQLVFSSEKSISYLQFVKSYEVEGL